MRYVAERGSGTNGTAYNRQDYEVLDTSRPAGRRIVARAARKDAEMIADSLNNKVLTPESTK